ncbi:MAG: alanine--tRNA ligase [Actinomycetota bacterium]|jgi:alanyl-tRNA synthetase|nr:alanine--tRNA ligase [Actinomycetota bacterium]
MDANQLRAAFTGYFASKDHEVVPSASLIPHDPSVLFTIAGMVPFKPYFLGDEPAPWPRATSVQKCFRTLDIDVVGRTTRHGTFFEMLGNFSFGDYFKERAIPYAWEVVTEVLGIDGDRLWVTVHETDDAAAEIWAEAVGVPSARIQRMGEDNFWHMGDTGPCGPCSELYFDKGEAHGSAGGPADGAAERYVEIWNLVFMEYNRLEDGTLAELPTKNIDTGAGLERILPILQGSASIFDTDVLAPLVRRAEIITRTRYGDDPRSDVALRVMADHGRAMTMLVADGVVPSNEGRGYVLRRIIRRAVLAARRLGVDAEVGSALVSEAIAIMGDAYPKLLEDADVVQEVITREEHGFDRTLRTGLGLLRDAIDDAGSPSGAARRAVLSGDVAFRLHDTHGFPIELTEEVAGESGIAVDRARFDDLMAGQRERARKAARLAPGADEQAYRALFDREGPTQFIGRHPDSYASPARVVGVLVGTEPATAEIFLDRTPFYAEGGGQVGDTGSIVTETGQAEVYDTVPALPGLTAHRVRITGEIFPGQDALATIDGARREAVRRNHTATHLLHAALRSVLGEHVRQQGSLVAPDRLRFDFTHHGALAPEELRAVVEMAEDDVLSNGVVETVETSRARAEELGAMAFFGDKYGDIVRMVRAGPHSLELCGGTHVDALGMIGPISIVSEGSIGSNTRRIEAVSASAAVERSLRRDAVLSDVATLLKVEPDGVVEALERLMERQRTAEREVARLRSETWESKASALAGEAGVDGLVVSRQDGYVADDLRDLAQAICRRHGIRSVVLGGSPDGVRVSLVAVTRGDPDAGALVKEIAALVGGGGGGSRQLGVAGGRDVAKLDAALDQARQLLGVP